jgi:CheY-like chemotaxis protein
MERPLVLIVEVEALIRMDAAAMVVDAGFQVLEAGDADEAVALLESRRGIRAVFTDINMSGSMDGWKLAHAIRDRWPPVHLLVTSGKGMPPGEELPLRGRFIPKPYRPEDVANALRALFEEAA